MKIVRKLIHIISGLLIVYLLYFFDEELKLYLIIGLGVIALLGLIIDFFRMLNSNFNSLFTKKLFSYLFTTYKFDGINSATFFFMASSMCIFFFDKDIAITSILILSLADPTASIVGKVFGKIKIGNKSLIGSLSFFIISFIICIISFDFTTSIITAIIITIVELVTLHTDDNITIPLISGFLLSIIQKGI